MRKLSEDIHVKGDLNIETRVIMDTNMSGVGIPSDYLSTGVLVFRCLDLLVELTSSFDSVTNIPETFFYLIFFLRTCFLFQTQV